MTYLKHGREPLAAILHDPALLEDPGLVAAVAATVRLAVDNERLTSKVEDQPTRSAPLALGSSQPGTPSDGASSGTSTTGHSSASCR